MQKAETILNVIREAGGCSLLAMSRSDPQRTNPSRMEDKLESRVR